MKSWLLAAAVALCVVPSVADAKPAKSKSAYLWPGVIKDADLKRNREIHRLKRQKLKQERRRSWRKKTSPSIVVPSRADVARLRGDISALRKELREFKERAAWGAPVPLASLPVAAVASLGEIVALPSAVSTVTLPATYDIVPPLQVPPPADPDRPLPAIIEDRYPAAFSVSKEESEAAKRYLVATATPGATMQRQGVGVAIGRLHPVFAVRLSGAVKEARTSGLPQVGCFSAYRPPAFGVGGFGDKFNSTHSYGLTCDMAGIGRPNSSMARSWHRIAVTHGLINPYFGRKAGEWNHYQLVEMKVVTRGNPLRSTITARGPKDLDAMWAAGSKHIKQVVQVAVDTVKTFNARASFYWQGSKTASGERFNPDGLTAAHRTLPFGTMLKVTNTRTKKSVVVRVNDRGPFIAGRTLDLSRGAARAIGFRGVGIVQVAVLKS